ncbi:MAG: glycosyltransferase [Marinilabiliaceae bacterium]|nr:glycosyltransferase [Marinilabiliaceae bacterium]
MKTNILLFIDWFLPGTKAGGPVRSMANLTGHLSDEYVFWVVTRNTEYCETVPYPNIESNKWIERESYLNVFYASSDKQNKETFQSIIRDPKFDKVYINGIYSYKFSILPLKIARKEKKKIIVAPRGMLNPQAFSVKPLKKHVFVVLSKILGFYKRVTFHATNDDEKRHIKDKISKRAKIIVAPNLPRKIITKSHTPLAKTTGTVRLVNIARVAPEKGTLHMFEYLSKVTSGNIILDVYGPIYNQAYWKLCEEKISQLPSGITVNYKGALEGEKVLETLQQYHFFFMPSEGENFGHSILEALTVGCPVIISNKTPWVNLESQHIGWDIPLTKTAKFAAVLDRVVAMNEDEYFQWSDKAFSFAKSYCNDEGLKGQSVRLFK